MSSTILEVVSYDDIWGGIKSKLLYTPLADSFTFGLYSKIVGNGNDETMTEEKRTVE